jgi:uncharacterized DUF497 family protein
MVQDARFEWDDDKAEQNLGKHHVSFEEARAAFDDAFGLHFYDEEHSTPQERRFICVGLAGTRVLFVSYTVGGERTRIIHARRATKTWERIYEKERGQN